MGAAAPGVDGCAQQLATAAIASKEQPRASPRALNNAIK
ncbi:hypothetical protein MA6G0728R_4354 [Mycobacteroides abscessus 6G-0728-R]|nr:hypothetical protein MMAS_41540 [Mycobacteroides abscessus subsp. massiliense CCUG 48898 = JCM 15300]EIU51882.1 hypothetical protein MA6G1108_4352 [Mycobacteroides abscessus 6G-1108]EIU53885.1 hypothetical protein MA6G0728S_4112 [Mycobacteroides abscessus 6G-0728-S]EIU95539.1 hypothetical protein MA6G0728R_4354 [Mycobacteroides abscessus 6G-0728-R]EIV31441.1 hypothetical protein MA3A0122S_4376 [Mycobacteroides abscessus 3A-0122-S]EIV69966.1 hypothetical protein MM3A0810R_4594 [Mycobacteroid